MRSYLDVEMTWEQFPQVGTQVTADDVVYGCQHKVSAETGDGTMQDVPAWEIVNGGLTDPVHGCMEIVARGAGTAFTASFVMCKATDSTWVVMDYCQGFTSLADIGLSALLRVTFMLGAVFNRIGADVDVVEWLEYYTNLGD